MLQINLRHLARFKYYRNGDPAKSIGSRVNPVSTGRQFNFHRSLDEGAAVIMNLLHERALFRTNFVIGVIRMVRRSAMEMRVGIKCGVDYERGSVVHWTR